MTTPQPFNGRFNRLIGLSPVAPNCTQANVTDDDITVIEYVDAEGNFQPASSLYATDIDSLNLDMSEALNDCGPDSLWQYLFDARRNALITMETDLLAALESAYKLRLQPFKGALGATRGAGVVQGLTEGQTVSVYLATKHLPGAFLKLHKIGLLLTHNATVEVSIPGLADPVSVVCSAHTISYATLPEPVSLPLDGNTLEFSYVVNGFRPYNTKLNCDCGGQQERINQYLGGLIDAPANGLVLTLEAGCNGLHSVYDSFEAGGAASRVLAAALRFQTLALAVERIINSGTIRRFTLMENDQLLGKRASYKKEYADRIHWLATDRGVDIAGCACFLPTMPETQIRKRGILS